MEGIKGTTQELFVGKDNIKIMTLIGSVKSIPYSDVKRIDYCFADGGRTGYIAFISLDNRQLLFEFKKKSNDSIEKAIKSIARVYPNIPSREYQQGENERDKKIIVTATFGHEDIGCTSPILTIRQKSNGDIYFNTNTAVYYALIDYKWDGPEFDVVKKTSGSSASTSQTEKKGKGLKIGAGAIIGSIIAPGAGTLVGAAMGAGSKGKSKTQGQTLTNSVETSKNVEKNTNGTITVRNLDNNKIYKISFKCNRDLDAKIRCLTLENAETKKDVIENVSMSLEGIKALKELLDMGAITQEEFDLKKNQILNS
jgi:hypothetical protein